MVLAPSRRQSEKSYKGLEAEELVAIHDTNKLLNDNGSLELFEETLPSPSLMQLQSDKRGVTRRARAVVRNSSGSPGVNLISMALGNEKGDPGVVDTLDTDTALVRDSTCE